MTKRKFTSYTIAALLLIAALVVGLGISINLSAKPDDIPEELRGLIKKQAIAVPEFELVDQKNQPLNKERLKGAWTFMFFGYTHCPDVCPLTLTELDNAANQINDLQNSNRKIQYVFISVDPNRDTPASLGEYVSYFGAKFIAATGSEQALKQLAGPLGIKFERGIGTENEYLVNHSSTMLLIDPQAQYYARFRAPHYAEEIIDGFKAVLTYKESKERQ
ncbi:SCO family protein [Kaarinaea lacus]